MGRYPVNSTFRWLTWRNIHTYRNLCFTKYHNKQYLISANSYYHESRKPPFRGATNKKEILKVKDVAKVELSGIQNRTIEVDVAPMNTQRKMEWMPIRPSSNRPFRASGRPDGSHYNNFRHDPVALRRSFWRHGSHHRLRFELRHASDPLRHPGFVCYFYRVKKTGT